MTAGGYHAAWRHGLPTDPQFFPVGVWFQQVTSTADRDADRTAGLNTYVLLTANSSLPLVADAMVVPQSSEWAANPAAQTAAVRGWFLTDEPDMNGTTPAALAATRTALPADGRPRYANFGKGVLFWNTDQDAAAWLALSDIASADAYWMTDPDLSGQWQGGKLLTGGARALTVAETRTGANYGRTVTRLQTLAPGKPVWGYVEVGQAFGGQAPSTAEVRSAVWHSIIAGASGIVYFTNSYGTAPTAHALRDPGPMRTAVTAVNQLVATLAPVLNSTEPATQPTVTGQVAVTVRQWQGCLWLLAASTFTQPQTVTFTVPGQRVRVVDEDRELSITAGRFTDTFADQNAVHIYRIS